MVTLCCWWCWCLCYLCCDRQWQKIAFGFQPAHPSKEISRQNMTRYSVWIVCVCGSKSPLCPLWRLLSCCCSGFAACACCFPAIFYLRALQRTARVQSSFVWKCQWITIGTTVELMADVSCIAPASRWILTHETSSWWAAHDRKKFKKFKNL